MFYKPGLLEECMPNCLFCKGRCTCAITADEQTTLANCECCDLPVAECLNRLAPELDVPDGFHEVRAEEILTRRIWLAA